jgi:L-ascorbate metabolism protein UlaG (beta-lactamase superfamily)
MKITYYGQSCFVVTTNGYHLLFDPFITGNPLATHIDVDQIPADYILVSHGHTDHIGDLLSIAVRTGAQVIAMAEVATWAKKQGISNTHQMNFGSANFPFGRVSYVPAWHSSSMPDGSYGGNPGGFVISNAEGAFYYAGDTSLMMDMQLIPHYAALTFAVLPIGGNYTMDVQDAIVASDFIKCNKIVGVHYNTFPVITINTNEAQKAFKDKGKELLLPAIGETLML